MVCILTTDDNAELRKKTIFDFTHVGYYDIDII